MDYTARTCRPCPPRSPRGKCLCTWSPAGRASAAGCTWCNALVHPGMFCNCPSRRCTAHHLAHRQSSPRGSLFDTGPPRSIWSPQSRGKMCKGKHHLRTSYKAISRGHTAPATLVGGCLPDSSLGRRHRAGRFPDGTYHTGLLLRSMSCSCHCTSHR